MAASARTTAPTHVAENRARMAAALGVEPHRLLTAYQIHSPDVVVAETPWTPEARPRADGIVTRMPGARHRRDARPIAGRFCSPIRGRGSIGAAHAGWRGALAGVVEATVAAMERLGAVRGSIRAALGPMIRQPKYEVGPDLIDRFAAEDPASKTVLRAGAARRPRPVRSRRLRRGAAARGPASATSRIWVYAPMPIRACFSATAAPPTVPRPITAGTSMPSCSPANSERQMNLRESIRNSPSALRNQKPAGIAGESRQGTRP